MAVEKRMWLCDSGTDTVVYRVDSPQRQTSLTGENCLLCGYLQLQDKGKSWSKMWAGVAKAEPLVLYLQSSGQVRRVH